MGKIDEAKLKANLKLTIERLRIQKKKRSNLADNEKRAVADLLAKDRIDDARIKCEGILKEDATCEAYEILELYCELLASRLSVLKLSKTVPSELNEAACTLCYAAGRHQNLTELSVIRQLLAAAYGKEYVQAAIVNSDGAVNATVVKKLAIATPSAAAVNAMMAAIATKYEVAWAPEAEPDPTTGVFPEVASTARVRPASSAAISADIFPTTGNGGGSGGSGATKQRPGAAKAAPPPAADDDDNIPAAPDFGDDEFPEPPPNLGGGGGGGGGGGVKATASSSGSSNSANLANRPAKKPPVGAVKVMQQSPAGLDPNLVMSVSSDAASNDDLDDLTARFEALKR